MDTQHQTCSKHGAYLGYLCPTCAAEYTASAMPDQPRQEREQLAERSKIMLGRAVNGRKALWWRVTIYVGDSREDIDQAVEEALRIDQLLSEVA